MKKLLYLPFVFLCFTTSFAQTPFSTIEYVDINNIKAAALVHGDMWWNPATMNQACEFPKGSGKNISHAGSLWIGGYDAQNQLRVSSQTYRQSGNDFWPGPLEGTSPITYAKSQDWAKIWKVNKTDIDAFKALSNHTVANTPQSILEWPAKGNPYAKGNNNVTLTISTIMAPFIDVNSDGNYDPLQGDYPKIMGDQMLWWIFNDDGPVHNHTQTVQNFRFEIKASAYAFKRNTLIDNVIFYQYDINNKSTLTYEGVRLGIRADMDLGQYNDDYIGFDSTRRLGYVYNADEMDGNFDPNTYDTLIPIAGITLLWSPGDHGDKKSATGAFTYYNNDNSIMGNPSTAADYNYLLRAQWLDGQHFTNDFTGPNINSDARGSGPNTNYAFPGDPHSPVQWSECASNNPPGDRRFIISTNDFSIKPAGFTSLLFALIATEPDTTNACGKITLDKLKETADSAWLEIFPVGTHISTVNNKPTFNTYPNPAHDKLYVTFDDQIGGNIVLYDVMGRMISQYPVTQNKLEINTTNLAPGLYSLVYHSNEITYAQKFLKE